MLRWDEETGGVGVFRRSAGNTNGNTLDRQGRLVSCEQGNRRVTRTEHDGTVTVLAFSDDERQLFVSDTRAGFIRVFDVREDGTLSEGKVFAEAAPGKGRFDNLRFDDGGRLWAAAMGDGVHCYDPTAR